MAKGVAGNIPLRLNIKVSVIHVILILSYECVDVGEWLSGGALATLAGGEGTFAPGACCPNHYPMIIY